MCHVLKKIRASNLPSKDDLITSCQRLVKTHSSDDTENIATEWTDLVDRGGLYHVKETTFWLFVALEDEIQKYLGQLFPPHAARVKDQFLLSLCAGRMFSFTGASQQQTLTLMILMCTIIC